MWNHLEEKKSHDKYFSGDAELRTRRSISKS